MPFPAAVRLLSVEKVRDGGGVEVDVKVAGAKLPAVEALLLSQGVLFDFATQWTQVQKKWCWRGGCKSLVKAFLARSSARAHSLLPQQL